MTKTTQLNDLFQRWRLSRSERFNPDGIRDEERWLLAPRRVLFLLKETNDFDGDLRELEYKAAGWHRIGSWAHAIHRTTHDSIPGFVSPTQDDSPWRMAHRASAFMNLKKTSGGGSAVLSKIRTVALEDKEFLKAELSIIEPEVVVACGPGMLELAYEVFDLSEPDAAGYRWQRHGKVTWIDFFHPSGRYPHFMYYYSLASIFRESLDSQ